MHLLTHILLLLLTILSPTTLAMSFAPGTQPNASQIAQIADFFCNDLFFTNQAGRLPTTQHRLTHIRKTPALHAASAMGVCAWKLANHWKLPSSMTPRYVKTSSTKRAGLRRKSNRKKRSNIVDGSKTRTPHADNARVPQSQYI
ncbi:hypothetical protein QBC36DRAFT_375802 [Triangularia setosa]|uniref:Secreted protein n=1 Tax=Triangularia setosa TaxID=2587417 RepID=A0AAN6WCT6_9PEZI|nr:hypothetical protein QBC36DRAFT_375802 [Podospora setosa]